MQHDFITCSPDFAPEDFGLVHPVPVPVPVCVCVPCGLCGVSCLLSALLTGGNLHPNPHRNLLPGPPNIDAFGKEFPAYVNVSTRRHVDKNR